MPFSHFEFRSHRFR